MPNNLNTSDNYITNMSLEERKQAGKKGGIKSGESRRQKRKMKELLETLMKVPVKKGKKVTNPEDIKNLATVNNINVDTQTALLLAQIQKAMGGDTQAFLAIRDTLGEKPIDKVEQTSEVVVIQDDI